VSSVTWLEKVRLANSEAEVVEVAREFLATLDHFEIALLPPRCAPRKMFVADDVAGYAFDLVDYEASVPESTAKVIQRMAAFFTQASVRLSELTMRTNDGEDSSLLSA
jgi:hypothetical protein